jgi:tetratricopeptide (TPR) repeat protein
VDVLVFLGQALSDLGRKQEATRVALEATVEAEAIQEPMFEVIAHGALAYVYRSCGEPQLALEAAQQGLKLGHGRVRNALIYPLYILGEALADLGDGGGALAIGEQVEQAAGKNGLRLEATGGLRIRGRALGLLGRHAEALQALEGAHAQMKALGAGLEVRRTEVVWAALGSPAPGQ